ncbi:MAG: methyltransferase domain-containing protein, partial [Thermotogae bacterium]|nr:methyltransferase domain-containing protein [Thermotogota bacterium]
MKPKKVGYKSIIDLGREARVYPPHNIGDYPTKILPQIIGEFLERFSVEDNLILDPFAGSGTVAVESALRKRKSINIDINPYALSIARKKINWLSSKMFKNGYEDKQVLIRADARFLPLMDESIDLIITDIPYADMIKYSNLEGDLSTIEHYPTFINEINKAFMEMYRVLKKGKY